MTGTFSTIQVRRSLDRSHRRKPLRVQITRRRTGKAAAEGPPSGAADNSYPAPKFVTQVRFGGREAVVLPWQVAHTGAPAAAGRLTGAQAGD